MVLAAAPAAVFAGVAVLLVIWATFYLFQKPITQLLSGLPLIGGWVAGVVSGAVGGLVQWGLSVFDSTIGAVLEVVTVPVTAVLGWLGQAVTFAEVMADQFASAVTSLGQGVASAYVTGVTAISRAAAALAAAASAAATAAAAMALGAYLRDRAIPAAEAGAISAAAAHAATLAHAEATERANADAQLRSVLSAETAARTAEAAAVRAWESGVAIPRLDSLQGELVQLGAVVGTLTAAQLIARVSTLESTLTRTLDECVTPTCNVLGPTLPALQGLANLGMVLSLGAVVGAAVHDPEGTARDVAGAAEGLHGVAAGLLSTFAGVRA